MVGSGGARNGFERNSRCDRNCAPPAVRLVSAPDERYARSFLTHCRCAPSKSAHWPRPTATPHSACSHHTLSGCERRACHVAHRAQGWRERQVGRRSCLPVHRRPTASVRAARGGGVGKPGGRSRAASGRRGEGSAGDHTGYASEKPWPPWPLCSCFAAAPYPDRLEPILLAVVEASHTFGDPLPQLAAQFWIPPRTTSC